MQILFVCSANMCRSAMAEGMARKLAAERTFHEPMTFRSAGLLAEADLPAVPEAVKAAAEYDVDIDAHCSTPFMLGVADGSDYLVAMTRLQKREMVRRLPVLAMRAYTLAEFIYEMTGRWPSWRDLDDPVGGPAEGYRRCAARIHQELTHVFDVLCGREPRHNSFLARQRSRFERLLTPRY